MATHDYDNPATQAERKAIVKNDSYFARQSNIVDDAGGRYAKITPSNLTGQSYQVPRLPENSPWSNCFDTNVEAQLGYAVDEMPAQEPTPSVASSADVPDNDCERNQYAVIRLQ